MNTALDVTVIVALWLALGLIISLPVCTARSGRRERAAWERIYQLNAEWARAYGAYCEAQRKERDGHSSEKPG